MQINKTNKEIITFINFAHAYLNANEGESKFKYAVGRMLKRCMTAHEKTQEQIEDINIDNCSEDDRGNIMRDERNQYVFTKPAMKARIGAQRELMRKSVQLEAYISTEPSVSPLSPDEFEICEGFVIDLNSPALEVVANG